MAVITRWQREKVERVKEQAVGTSAGNLLTLLFQPGLSDYKLQKLTLDNSGEKVCTRIKAEEPGLRKDRRRMMAADTLGELQPLSIHGTSPSLRFFGKSTKLARRQ